jgi:hypothetical protein
VKKPRDFRVLIALELPGRLLGGLFPETPLGGPARLFDVRKPHSLRELGCPATYSSTRTSGEVTSRMELVLRGVGLVTIDQMPNHLIGPGGMVGPGTEDASVSISGMLVTVGP